MKPISPGEALDRALQMPELPELDSFARRLQAALARDQLFWLASVLWLAIDQDDKRAFIDADRRAEMDTFGEELLKRLELDLILFDDAERRAVLVAFWRSLTEQDRRAFLRAVAAKKEGAT